MGSSPVPPNNIVQQSPQAQQNWMPASQQNGPQTGVAFANQQMPPNQHFRPPFGGGPLAVQNNSSQMPLQPGQGLPRPIPATPQQTVSGQGLNQTAPQMGPHFSSPSQQQSGSGPPQVPPLDRNRFNGSYKHFCQTKKLVLDDRLMAIQGRTIDLHLLHVEVMNAGGSQRVCASRFVLGLSLLNHFQRFPLRIFGL